MGGKSWSVTRFFYTNSAKAPLCLHSIEWRALHLLLSQPVGRGFEPGLVREIFSGFPASRSWVRSSPSPYFFAIRVPRKISQRLAGVLFVSNSDKEQTSVQTSCSLATRLLVESARLQIFSRFCFWKKNFSHKWHQHVLLRTNVWDTR